MAKIDPLIKKLVDKPVTRRTFNKSILSSAASSSWPVRMIEKLFEGGKKVDEFTGFVDIVRRKALDPAGLFEGRKTGYPVDDPDPDKWYIEEVTREVLTKKEVLKEELQERFYYRQADPSGLAANPQQSAVATATSGEFLPAIRATSADELGAQVKAQENIQEGKYEEQTLIKSDPLPRSGSLQVLDEGWFVEEGYESIHRMEISPEESSAISNYSRGRTALYNTVYQDSGDDPLSTTLDNSGRSHMQKAIDINSLTEEELRKKYIAQPQAKQHTQQANLRRHAREQITVTSRLKEDLADQYDHYEIDYDNPLLRSVLEGKRKTFTLEEYRASDAGRPRPGGPRRKDWLKATENQYKNLIDQTKTARWLQKKGWLTQQARTLRLSGGRRGGKWREPGKWGLDYEAFNPYDEDYLKREFFLDKGDPKVLQKLWARQEKEVGEKDEKRHIDLVERYLTEQVAKYGIKKLKKLMISKKGDFKNQFNQWVQKAENSKVTEPVAEKSPLQKRLEYSTEQRKQTQQPKQKSILTGNKGYLDSPWSKVLSVVFSSALRTSGVGAGFKLASVISPGGSAGEANWSMTEPYWMKEGKKAKERKEEKSFKAYKKQPQIR